MSNNKTCTTRIKEHKRLYTMGNMINTHLSLKKAKKSHISTLKYGNFHPEKWGVTWGKSQTHFSVNCL